MQKKKHWNQSTCKHIDAKSWQFKTRQHCRLPILEFTNPNYSETSKLVYLKPDHDTHRTRQHLRQCFLSGFCNLTLFQGVISADLKRFSCICPERLNVFLIALDHTISQLSTDPICRWIVTKVWYEHFSKIPTVFVLNDWKYFSGPHHFTVVHRSHMPFDCDRFVIWVFLKNLSCICPERLNVFLIALDHTISQLSTDPICRWIVTKVCILNPRPGNETAGQGVKHDLMALKYCIYMETKTQKVTELRLPGG